MKPITQFTDEYDFLSNFYSAPIEWGWYTYPTSEHAFQAAKATIPEDAKYVRDAPTPGEAKKRGRKIEMRANWDNIRVTVMADILRAKFAQHPDLKARLLATGDAQLVEGTYWHDQFWGICNCSKHGGKGENQLGKALMRLRQELRAKVS